MGVSEVASIYAEGMSKNIEVAMKTMKKKYLLLITVYAMFFALGMPDGAFGVAWPRIRYEMGLPLERAAVLIVAHSIFYSLSGWQTGRLASVFRLERISSFGLGVILAGILGFSFSPNFFWLAVSTAVLGVGMGTVDSGINAFTAKRLSARHMSWLHCFWGLGGAVSPIIVSQMIVFYDWRLGYRVIFAIQAAVAFFAVASIAKGYWAAGEGEAKCDAAKKPVAKAFLKARKFQVMQWLIFFIYTAFEYSITFWTPVVLYEARGLEIDIVGVYASVYLGFMVIGRFLFGYAARKISVAAAIRIGLTIAAAGLFVLAVSNNIAGSALIGFGFAPVFPCLMHATKSRFDPALLSKLVGLQIAATGAGVILSALAMGQILTRVSPEALFPVVLGCVVFAFALNEIIEWNLINVRK